jgi:tRNA (guanine37-N1)-methyltransferase
MNKKAPHFNLITLFPEIFPGFLGTSLSGKALDKKLWSYAAINPRDFTTDAHKTVDDTPFGGGAGMVMKPDVLDRAIRSLQPAGRLIYMSPRGLPLTQKKVEDLTQEPATTILCGRYEGVDQRLIDAYQIEEISIGDYVLSGGEQAALILMDAVIRLLPDVIGNTDTHREESFSNHLLEYPHYTRPVEWAGPDGVVHKVPEILSSGHHAKINQWRKEQAEKLTQHRRPDLWEKYKKTTNTRE